MNNTPNINLSTYTSNPNDKFNLMVTFNENMNKIDTAVGSQNDQIDVIEATASTAVTTANSAVTTATEALTTANSKTSVNDNVASNTETYSSNKINQLVEEAGGAVIDDSTTSSDSTWSSSKINTQINTKASINDTTASNSTTYSSNKINQLIEDVGGFPDYQNKVEVANTSTLTGDNELSASYTTTEDCYIYGKIQAKPSTNSFISLSIGGGGSFAFLNDASKNLFNQTPLFKVKANTTITCSMTSVASGTVHDLSIYKLGIIN
jgi:hypothetical protein